MTKPLNALTPRQLVAALDQYIIGQKQAKRAVAVALRNRFRRSLLDEAIRDDVIPKNLLLIGPTGVGKTEIARRIAKLTGSPFIKVEATKFTEVGYVGRDVESMIRDLLESSIRMVKTERLDKVKPQAEKAANERIVQALVPSPGSQQNGMRNPLELLFGQGNQPQQKNEAADQQADEKIRQERARIRERLARGELELEPVTIEIPDTQPTLMDMVPGMQSDPGSSNLQDMLNSMMPKRMKTRTLKVKEARPILTQEEANKLIDPDDLHQEAIRLAEQHGIVFIDEIDKIASGGRGGGGPDVSREGVQRDILPIVEGSTVNTKYGPVKTDYILFIAAGAFHISKPSDLIPELQGRFPIRVELNRLNEQELVRILTEPKNALTRQYQAMLRTEGLEIEFDPEAILELARLAAYVNEQQENIGARRLHTILERLLEDLSFEAPDLQLDQFLITPQYVREKLADLSRNRDLSQYIL